MIHVETMLKILDLNIDAYSKGSLGLPEEWRIELLRLAHLGAKAEAQKAISAARAAVSAVHSGRLDSGQDGDIGGVRFGQ